MTKTAPERTKECITCLKHRPVAEFYPDPKGTIRRDCNECRSVETLPLVILPLGYKERRAAREALATGSCTPCQRQMRWDYYGGRCWMCGRAARVMDHVKPLARGGCAWPSNLRPACWGCNRRKAANWPLPSWTSRK